jgi:hypothetical protein
MNDNQFELLLQEIKKTNALLQELKSSLESSNDKLFDILPEVEEMNRGRIF